MNIYLAAAWSKREEMKKLAEELEREILGLKISSRWVRENPYGSVTNGCLAPNKKIAAIRRILATNDRSDLYGSDILIRFTDDLSAKTVPSYLATGTRMAEMGMALARGIPVIVVGGNQCVFDYLSEVQHVKNVAELKRTLRRIVNGEKLAHRKSAATLKRALRDHFRRMDEIQCHTSHKQLDI